MITDEPQTVLLPRVGSDPPQWPRLDLDLGEPRVPERVPVVARPPLHLLTRLRDALYAL